MEMTINGFQELSDNQLIGIDGGDWGQVLQITAGTLSIAAGFVSLPVSGFGGVILIGAGIATIGGAI